MELYNLDTELTFGKYKGETVLDILKKESTYISSYCLVKREGFYITDEVYEASIIYGYKGSIDEHVAQGHSAEEAINICKKADPNKDYFKEKMTTLPNSVIFFSLFDDKENLNIELDLNTHNQVKDNEPL